MNRAKNQTQRQPTKNHTKDQSQSLRSHTWCQRQPIQNHTKGQLKLVESTTRPRIRTRIQNPDSNVMALTFPYIPGDILLEEVSSNIIYNTWNPDFAYDASDTPCISCDMTTLSTYLASKSE